jgi:acyl carrier protein
MNNPELKTLFATALAIDIEKVTPELAYGTIPEWDSTAHMILIAEIEDKFEVMLDTDDIIDMSSVAKADEIITKYLSQQ